MSSAYVITLTYKYMIRRSRLDVKTRLYIRYLKKYEQDITGMVTITKDPA